jgi:transmembrane protein EpsG|uniref:EpsG family protein n=1 Tax=Ruminococcus bromii TaxID=40518 RepID=UPI003FED88B1
MTKLLPTFFACMILAIISERYSIREGGKLEYQHKDKIFYFMIVVLMIFLAGLRVRYNDTATYISAYENLDTSGKILSSISWNIGDNPAFNLINLILKKIGISVNGFIMFYSSVTVGLYLWFVKKYSNDFALSWLILFTGGAYIFSFAAIKQCMAIAISLVAIDALLEKKKIKFVVCILVATLFHTYALLFLAAPLLLFPVWSFKSYLLICLTAIVGIGFQALLGNILSITSLLGENYDIASFSGEGVNIFRLLVALAPVILSFVVKEDLRKSENRIERIMMNLTMINAALMFIASFGTAFYLARVANYFAIFPVISIPYLLKYFTEDLQILLKIIIIVGYLGYFVYAYGIVRGGFDFAYDSISLFQFVGTLFAH